VVSGKRKKKATVEFLVDGGAVYTLLPETDWKAIGLKPKRKMTFTLADGTKVERSVVEGYMRVVDDAGEGFLYSAGRFVVVNFPAAVQRRLLAASSSVA